MNPAEREQHVGRAFVTLADTLVDDYDVVDLLDLLVGHCVTLLTADAAGILLGDTDGRLQAVAASGGDVSVMKLLTSQSADGPAFESYRTGAQVQVPDIARTARRWPGFAATVAEDGGIVSMLAVPLRLRGDTIGALSLFSRAAGPLPRGDLRLGQALADVATIGIVSERTIRQAGVLNDQLQTALTSRVTIEQAKGVLSQRFDIPPGDAFDRLRGYARNHNRRLADLAQDLVGGALSPDTFATMDEARDLDRE